MMPHSPEEWRALHGTLAEAGPTSGCSLEGVDMLAKYAGWMTKPPAERAQRYLAAYAPIGADAMWRAEWGRLAPETSERIKQYRKVNPRPSLATMQVLAHMAGSDAGN